ncbi:MAG: hypothetical protein H0T57_11495, partial [Rubrobacter sp.]|nr:hypothetical protein [Rubrobacter sp.]MDQ3638056.1 hypothetical protein [Actinomycetota bacterium]
VGLSRRDAEKVFEVIGRHSGGSPLFLVSDDGTLEEQICTVEDCSDLHAELKQLLGSRCISGVRKTAEPGAQRQTAEPEMEQVS